MKVTRRQGRRCKKLLDDLKDRRGYSHLKEEALDHGPGSVVGIATAYGLDGPGIKSRWR